MRSWHKKHLGVIVVSTIQMKRGKQISVVLKHTWVNQFWIRCPTRHAKTCRRLARVVVTQTRHEVAAASEPQVVTGHHLPGTGHLGTVKVLTTIPTPSPHSLLQSPPNSIKKQHFALLEYRSQQTVHIICVWVHFSKPQLFRLCRGAVFSVQCVQQKTLAALWPFPKLDWDRGWDWPAIWVECLGSGDST